jgi:diguanylate cyclase (GGDEF)-like protein
VLSWSLCKRVHDHILAWPLLRLPAWLTAFVAVVVVTDAAAIGITGRAETVTVSDLVIFGLLMLCSVVTVEMTRRLGEAALMIQDIFGVWELPAAILLPPMLAMLAPLPRFALTQLRVRKIDLHRRVFSAAAVSLAFGCASAAFHLLTGSGAVALTGSGVQAAGWILAVAASGALMWVVNNALVMTAVKGSDRSASIRQMLFTRKSLQDDALELSVATVVAAAVAVSPVTLIFALPFVSLLQRSLRHSQLVDAARIDGKTGLFNPVTWRRESSGELARAHRTGMDLAVALIDIDHFKAVNDKHGHLIGDEALRAVSRAIQRSVRDYDLVGRFGGEEFSLLMPHADAVTALRIAERIRAEVGDLRIETPAGPQEPVQMTVSVGVAALSGPGTTITDLLAAADAALYRAKDAGRNQVQLAAGAGTALPLAQPVAVRATEAG